MQRCIEYLSCRPLSDNREDLPEISTKHNRLPTEQHSSQLIVSRMLLSNASIACLFVMEASSQIMREAVCRSLPVPLYFVKLQNAPLSILSGILEREGTVLPPGVMEVATLDVVVATTILLCLHIVASNALYREVFPVLLGPSIKNTLPSSLSTADRISS